MAWFSTLREFNHKRLGPYPLSNLKRRAGKSSDILLTRTKESRRMFSRNKMIPFRRPFCWSSHHSRSLSSSDSASSWGPCSAEATLGHHLDPPVTLRERLPHSPKLWSGCWKPLSISIIQSHKSPQTRLPFKITMGSQNRFVSLTGVPPKWKVNNRRSWGGGRPRDGLYFLTMSL